jgi:uncharacterized membrane protein YvbJ
MICNTCGRQIKNEAANFCEYCGASFREQVQAASSQGLESPFYNRQTISEQSPYTMSGIQQNIGREKPISFREWIGFYALLLVPILNIVILTIWAFSYSTPENKKTWARATLIFIVIVYLILFSLFVESMIYTLNSPMFQK